MASRADVVIVAFHRPRPLRATVPALLAAGFGVVVVNVEADLEVTAILRESAAIEVPTEGNVGFGAAVNAGVAATSAGIVVFMNDDVSLAPDAIMTLCTLVAAGTCSVVVPAVTSGGDRREPTISALPSVGRLLVEWALTPDHRPKHLPLMGIQKWRSPVQRERIVAASAVVVACRRDVLVDLPLPSAYFLYWEESEWFWHLNRKGIDVWYEPAAEVRHAGGRDDLRPAKAELLARNAVRCVRRTQGRAAAALAWPVVLLWNARLVAAALARVGLRPSDRTRQDLRARLAGLRSAWRSVGEVL